VLHVCEDIFDAVVKQISKLADVKISRCVDETTPYVVILSPVNFRLLGNESSRAKNL
jgi:hypothetical protein